MNDDTPEPESANQHTVPATQGKQKAQSNGLSLWRDQGVLALIIVAATILLGLALDVAKSAFGLQTVMVAAGVMLLLLVLVTYCAFKILVSRVITEIEGLQLESASVLTQSVNRLTTQMQIALKQFDSSSAALVSANAQQLRGLSLALSDGLHDNQLAMEALKAMLGKEWLISRAALLDIEKKAKVEEIWIISRSLEEETNKEFLEIVRKNIKRGVRYRYITMDEPNARSRAEKIRAAHEFNERVTVHFVSDQLFALVAAHDIAIFGPIGLNAHESVAFMNLPLDQGGNDFFIRLGPRHTQEIVGQLLNRVITIGKPVAEAREKAVPTLTAYSS